MNFSTLVSAAVVSLSLTASSFAQWSGGNWNSGGFSVGVNGGYSKTNLPNGQSISNTNVNWGVGLALPLALATAVTATATRWVATVASAAMDARLLRLSFLGVAVAALLRWFRTTRLVAATEIALCRSTTVLPRTTRSPFAGNRSHE